MKSGSILSVSIGLVPYDVAADADITKTPEVLNEAVRHSGGSSQKVTKLTGELTGVTLLVDTGLLATLEASAKSIINIPMSILYADGSSFSAPGWINLAEHTSMENRVDVSMFPASGTWIRFGL